MKINLLIGETKLIQFPTFLKMQVYSILVMLIDHQIKKSAFLNDGKISIEYQETDKEALKRWYFIGSSNFKLPN